MDPLDKFQIISYALGVDRNTQRTRGNKMKTQFSIERMDDKSAHPIHHIYPNQNDPQDGFIEIDPEKKTIEAGYNPEIGDAVPADVWNGDVFRFGVNSFASGETLNDMMEEIIPLAEKLADAWEKSDHDGIESIESKINAVIESWDGSDDGKCDGTDCDVCFPVES